MLISAGRVYNNGASPANAYRQTPEPDKQKKERLPGRQNRQENPDDYANVPDPVRNEERNQPKKTYSGPSVLSWSLEGRKASHLPIPAYRCMGFGQVTVIITVNNNGQVINAKVDEGASSSDSCLRNFAIRAARLSRFNISQTAPSRQMGTITYAFIAQ